MAGTKYIAVRPGFKQQAEAAFQGIPIEVDDTLTQDYEFRERKTLLDVITEQTDREDSEAADPKQAHTYVVPLTDVENEDVSENGFVVIRVSKSAGRHEVTAALREIEVKTSPNSSDVPVPLNLGNIRRHLQDKGLNVLSVSFAEYLTFLGPDR